jgi:hypothetical protein
MTDYAVATTPVVNVDFLVQPDSSFIEVVGYANDGGGTYVQMHGTTYGYSGVPYGAFAALVTADSPGHYYSTDFRPEYGPAVNMGEVNLEVREVPVEFVDIDDILVSDVDSVGADTDWIERNLRSEALNLAVAVHKGTASDSYSIVKMANSFKEYLNG